MWDIFFSVYTFFFLTYNGSNTKSGQIAQRRKKEQRRGTKAAKILQKNTKLANYRAQKSSAHFQSCRAKRCLKKRNKLFIWRLFRALHRRRKKLWSYTSFFLLFNAWPHTYTVFLLHCAWWDSHYGNGDVDGIHFRSLKQGVQTQPTFLWESQLAPSLLSLLDD